MPGREAGVSPSKFFTFLYQGIGHGYIEIRPLLDNEDPRKHTDAGRSLEYRARRFFLWPNEVQKAEDYCLSISGKEFHVYFGVALRKSVAGGKKEDVGCCTAVFSDIDFKDVPEDKARELLSKFPLRPSVVVKSGRGVHVYWLLKNGVMASSFSRLEHVNRSILIHLGAQRGPQDVSRILRVPMTANIKKSYGDPKPLTEVSYFKPETKYDFDEFIKIFPEPEAEQKKLFPPKVAGAKASAGPLPVPPGPGPSLPASPAPATVPPPAPTRELTAELTQKLAELLTGIWFNGHRHYLSMYISGLLAHAGYTMESAIRLITGVCTLAMDTEINDREKVCRDTYTRHLSGQTVAGAPTLEKMINELPGILKDQAKKIYEIVRKSIPRAEKKSTDREPNFEIMKVLKFDSRPAIWSVKLKVGSEEHAVSCETTILTQYQTFQAAAFEQAHVMLGEMKQTRWRQMLGDASHLIETKETPREARPDGAIETAIEEFLEDARQNPEIGLLKTFSGYDDESNFFRLDAFKRFLKEKGHRFDDQVLLDRIKEMGWKSSVKRFGEKLLRLWVKGVHSNGNGKAHQPAAPTDLFPQEGSK
jgi:hypothetical protein